MAYQSTGKNIFKVLGEPRIPRDAIGARFPPRSVGRSHPHPSRSKPPGQPARARPVQWRLATCPLPPHRSTAPIPRSPPLLLARTPRFDRSSPRVGSPLAGAAPRRGQASFPRSRTRRFLIFSFLPPSLSLRSPLPPLLRSSPLLPALPPDLPGLPQPQRTNPARVGKSELVRRAEGKREGEGGGKVHKVRLSLR
uniref:Uncharacterized protein n=1 Tax=Oryza nivara TaxID=4536 RepID=A0A0E0GSM7_ORYNI